MLLDASAILALINEEPFTAELEVLVPEGNVLSVTYAEVVGQLAVKGDTDEVIRTVLDALDFHVIELDAETAFAAGMLRSIDKSLSLGDRCCLAFAARTGTPLLTGDRHWQNFADQLKIDVQLIR